MKRFLVVFSSAISCIILFSLCAGCAKSKLGEEHVFSPVYYGMCHAPMENIHKKFMTESVSIKGVLLGGISGIFSGALFGAILAPAIAASYIPGAPGPDFAAAAVVNAASNSGLGATVYSKHQDELDDLRRISNYKENIKREISDAKELCNLIKESYSCYNNNLNCLKEKYHTNSNEYNIHYDELISGICYDANILHSMIIYLYTAYMEYLEAINAESIKLLSPDERSKIGSDVESRINILKNNAENKDVFSKYMDRFHKAALNPNFFATDKTKYTWRYSEHRKIAKDVKKNIESVFPYIDSLKTEIQELEEEYSILNTRLI